MRPEAPGRDVVVGRGLTFQILACREDSRLQRHIGGAVLACEEEFSGARSRTQSMAVDPSGNPLELVLTNGLAATIG